jgi:DNA-binding protein HU-beta
MTTNSVCAAANVKPSAGPVTIGVTAGQFAAAAGATAVRAQYYPTFMEDGSVDGCRPHRRRHPGQCHVVALCMSIQREDERHMNKSDLAGRIAEKADLNKTQASAALDATLDSIGDALASGEKVQIAGFGSFTVRQRAARKGRNPQTGQVIDIAASKNVGFSAGKELKNKVS